MRGVRSRSRPSVGGLGGIGSFQDVTILALGPGSQASLDLTVGFRRATSIRCAPLPRLCRHQRRRLGDRPPVATSDGRRSCPRSRWPIRRFPSRTSRSISSRPASSRRSASPIPRSCAWSACSRRPGHGLKIPLAAVATDIDLPPDGSRVYVVLRDAETLAIIDIPGDRLTRPTSSSSTCDATRGWIILSRDGTRACCTPTRRSTNGLRWWTSTSPAFRTRRCRSRIGADGRHSPDDRQRDCAARERARCPVDRDPLTTSSTRATATRCSISRLGSRSCRSPRSTPGSSPTPPTANAYIALDGGDALTATRAIQIVPTQTGVVHRSARLAAVGGRHPARREPDVRRRSATRSAACRSSTRHRQVRTVTGFDLNSHVVELRTS